MVRLPSQGPGWPEITGEPMQLKSQSATVWEDVCAERATIAGRFQLITLQVLTPDERAKAKAGQVLLEPDRGVSNLDAAWIKKSWPS